MGWRELGHQNDRNGPKWIFKMSQMHQNQWSEFAKINQSEQNGAKWGGPGHQNDPNGPKWIFKMSQMHQNESSK